MTGNGSSDKLPSTAPISSCSTVPCITLSEESTDHKTVEEIIMSEYEEIKQNGVTKQEVDKAKAQLIANMKFRQDGSYMVAGI